MTCFEALQQVCLGVIRCITILIAIVVGVACLHHTEFPVHRTQCASDCLASLATQFSTNIPSRSAQRKPAGSKLPLRGVRCIRFSKHNDAFSPNRCTCVTACSHAWVSPHYSHVPNVGNPADGILLNIKTISTSRYLFWHNVLCCGEFPALFHNQFCVR